MYILSLYSITACCEIFNKIGEKIPPIGRPAAALEVLEALKALEPRVIDFTAKEIEFLVREPEDSLAVYDGIACVEGIPAFSRGEEFGFGELDWLFRVWIETACEQIKRPARLVGVWQGRIERVVHQCEIHAAGGLASFPIIQWAGGARMLVWIAVGVLQYFHGIPCGTAVAALQPQR